MKKIHHHAFTVMKKCTRFTLVMSITYGIVITVQMKKRESEILSKKKNMGKQFEKDVEDSCQDQNIFYFRVRDVNLPPDVRMRVKLPQNKYDALLFYKEHLLPVEMKSTKSKSISFSESMIKANQIRNLQEAVNYEGVIAGFIFNFREPENKAYFVHIEDFVKYKHIAENEIKEHTYQNKVNKSSIPIGICEEIGIEITNVKKRTNYRYLINKMIDEVTEKYQLIVN